MNKSVLRIIFLSCLLSFSSLMAQQLSEQTMKVFTGLHTGNRIGISFHDDGLIAGNTPGVDIRGEWPYGTGENYIGDCVPLIGVEFTDIMNRVAHSVAISHGPRNGQGSSNTHPKFRYYWGWQPRPGFRNNESESIAMSHLPASWPKGGWWNDGLNIANNWVDSKGNTQWYGYFGRGIINADQESLFEADDQWDDKYNFFDNDQTQVRFLPDANNPQRHGMGLSMRVRGFQWSSFLAEDALFWLYDIRNEGTTVYRKADFGTTVGTLAGGDGDSQDDLADFDPDDWITYSYDSPPGLGNRGQKVGYVGYAFLESPGNPYDGIDNDNDSKLGTAPRFTRADFDSNGVVYNAGENVVLIDPVTYERSLHAVKAPVDTVYSLGQQFIIVPGVTKFREGWTARRIGAVAYPHATAHDGIDNDLDGLIDENQTVHYLERFVNGAPVLQKAVSYKDYRNNIGIEDKLIDEKRDNAIDEDGDWTAEYDDVGIDGLGPQDFGYPGPDKGENNGIPDQGEPNFGRTDPDESDQIGLTSFNFFSQALSPDLSDDELVWERMTPGRFDVIPPQPQDGDFIYASGYFPLMPANGDAERKERFSVSLLFGEDYNDIVSNKQIVQQIYNAGYKFPQPPLKPTVTATQEDGKVVLYWDGKPSESSVDFITKKKDFQGYKIYRATEFSFQDSKTITNGMGYLMFDKPIAQYDLDDSIKGFFYPSGRLFEQVGGVSYYLGSNTGIVNKFVDSTVQKGVTYYYAVCAYDAGDEAMSIFPSEDPKFIRRASNGAIITDLNTAYITPGARPVGYKDAKRSDLIKSDNFIGSGDVEVEILDDARIKSGYTYKIAFKDTGLSDQTSTWSLIDMQTPDTVYIPETRETIVVKPNETISIPSGVDTILVGGEPLAVTGSSYTATYHKLITDEDTFLGNTPIRDGFRLQIYNNNNISVDTNNTRTGWFGDLNKARKYDFKPYTHPSQPRYNGVVRANDYQIEFSTDSTFSVQDTTMSPRKVIPPAKTNFRIKNLTTGEYIDYAYQESGTLTKTYTIFFKERFNGKYARTWRTDIFSTQAGEVLPKTGVLKLSTLKPFNQKDTITFKMEGAKIDNAVAKSSMDMINVVPNPYIVTHVGEARLLSTQTSGRGEREVRFTHIPPGSKISIFTVRGELIKTLKHDNLFVGDVYWNLRTEENLDVAFGVYVYVVESPGIGSKIGKLALIK